MENFKKYYKSLLDQLDENMNLSSVLEFITYFRTDNIDLYKEFDDNYHDVGYYDVDTLIDLYCRCNNIELKDENANVIFGGLVDNIWNNGMSYHLTTSISALNIYENGMNPSEKEVDVLNDIYLLSSVLSDEKKKFFFPFAMSDVNNYSYSTIPKLNVNYGKRPEWYLNLILYSKGSLDEVLNKVMIVIDDESDLAKRMMVDVVTKYYNLYDDSVRTLVVIPGLNRILSKELIDSFDVNDVNSLKKGVSSFLSIRSSGIDSKSDKLVPNSELLFINTMTREIIDFDNENKIEK